MNTNLYNNIRATINNDNSFNVNGYDASFPYVGEYDNYREMDAAAEHMLNQYPNGYVCHVAHNKSNEYVLMQRIGSRYIIVE